MNFRLWLRLISLASAAFVSSIALAQANQAQIVFQKQLPQKQTLIVFAEEVPYIIPPEVKNLGPNVHFGIPDHVYLYTFQVRSGLKEKLLWSRRSNHYSDSSALAGLPMKVLDATISKGKLCVVYKETGMTSANIITPNAPANKPEVGWVDAIITTDSDAKEIFIIAATVAGSLEKNNLSVDLNNNNTQTFRYHLVTKKWVRDGSIPIPASAAK